MRNAVIDMQEYEIEFKNIVSKKEFDTLVHAFCLSDDDFIIQCNLYFDTHSFTLKEKQSALRIRNKQNKYQLTLKEPYQKGLLETHQPLTKEQVQILVQNGQLPDGKVKEKIGDLHFIFLGELNTKRAEISYKNGLLVFDHSTYLQCEDYEIEYEVSNFQKGKMIFLELLQKFQIPKRETKNKIQRFFEKKLELESAKQKE